MPLRAGQLAVRAGLLRQQRVVVSAAVTPLVIAGRLDGGAVAGAQARANLESIAHALQVFGSAAYGRAAAAEDSMFDAAIEQATSGIRRLHVGTLWPMRTAEAVARSVTGFWG